MFDFRCFAKEQANIVVCSYKDIKRNVISTNSVTKRKKKERNATNDCDAIQPSPKRAFEMISYQDSPFRIYISSRRIPHFTALHNNRKQLYFQV